MPACPPRHAEQWPAHMPRREPLITRWECAFLELQSQGGQRSAGTGPGYVSGRYIWVVQGGKCVHVIYSDCTSMPKVTTRLSHSLSPRPSRTTTPRPSHSHIPQPSPPTHRVIAPSSDPLRPRAGIKKGPFLPPALPRRLACAWHARGIHGTCLGSRLCDGGETGLQAGPAWRCEVELEGRQRRRQTASREAVQGR